MSALASCSDAGKALSFRYSDANASTVNSLDAAPVTRLKTSELTRRNSNALKEVDAEDSLARFPIRRRGVCASAVGRHARIRMMNGERLLRSLLSDSLGRVFTNGRLRAARSAKTVNRVRSVTAAQPTGMRGQIESDAENSVFRGVEPGGRE
jgi:hypothetical protein